MIRSLMAVLAAKLIFMSLMLIGIPTYADSSLELEIGSPKQAGASEFRTGVYHVSGSGADLGGRRDQFHLSTGILTGNGIVIARVTGIGDTSPMAKTGVMLRNDSTPGSAFAAVVVTPSHRVFFQWRAQAGAVGGTTKAVGIGAPIWVKVTRKGSQVTGSYSRDGAYWKQIGKAQTVPLLVNALAGVAVTSHQPSVLSTSTLTNVAVTPDVDGRYLHTQANGLRNRHGDPVTLRGTNVGGWLVTEGWMNGQTDNGGRFALEQMEARFGPVRAATLINTWRDHWFTTADLANIQSYGFNLIRVPFSWRNLQDAQGRWYRDASGQIDFSRFDWLVQEAAKYGIYVIFVYHIWPGQDKNYGDICQLGEPGTIERAQSVAIWSALAKHFKGNGTIAAFDLINEPTGSNDFYAAHRAFYHAIRAEDPERMLVAEWVNTADFPRLGWTNTICSGHYPAGNKADLDKFVSALPNHTEYSKRIPCFVGEFKSDDSSNVTQNAIDIATGMDTLGWAWAVWTYKTVDEGGWGLFDYDHSMRYNLATDSYESLLAKWQNGLTQWQDLKLPKNYYLKSDIIDGLRQGAQREIGLSVKKPGTKTP